MKELFDAWKEVDRNKVAALLSVFPGLGHFYKHHYLAGLGIMTVGNTLVVFVTAWLLLATFGVSLLMIPAWIAGVAYAAHEAPDHHGAHPWLHVWEHRWAHAFRGKAKH